MHNNIGILLRNYEYLCAAGRRLAVYTKEFFRNFVALIFAAAMLLRTEEKFSFDRKNLPYLLLRAFFGTMGILGNFYAIDHLVLADASMLKQAVPLFRHIILRL